MTNEIHCGVDSVIVSTHKGNKIQKKVSNCSIPACKHSLQSINLKVRLPIEVQYYNVIGPVLPQLLQNINVCLFNAVDKSTSVFFMWIHNSQYILALASVESGQH